MSDKTESVKKADMEKDRPSSDDRSPEVLSFRAIVVVTKHNGGKPTLESVEKALRKLGVKFVMPADVSGSVVISVNDQ